jgi:hypothetical protein
MMPKRKAPALLVLIAHSVAEGDATGDNFSAFLLVPLGLDRLHNFLVIPAAASSFLGRLLGGGEDSILLFGLAAKHAVLEHPEQP